MRHYSIDLVDCFTRSIIDLYGFDNDYADVILHTIQSVHDSTTLTQGDLIRFIERAIDNGSTHEVSTSTGADSVTVQTIHTAKIIEYPIVVMANMNDGRFPPSVPDSAVLRYVESVGLRQRKLYGEIHEHPHVYDNWRHDVLRHCLPGGYDEERRLLYVAITRAESHVVFAAGVEPNVFLESLPVEIGSVVPAVESIDSGETTQAQLPFSISPPDGPVGLTPHALMDDFVFEHSGEETETADGRGKGFSSRVHEFAEDYVRSKDVAPSNADERRVKRFLVGLDGELYVEEQAVLPLETDGD